MGRSAISFLHVDSYVSVLTYFFTDYTSILSGLCGCVQIELGQHLCYSPVSSVAPGKGGTNYSAIILISTLTLVTTRSSAHSFTQLRPEQSSNHPDYTVNYDTCVLCVKTGP